MTRAIRDFFVWGTLGGIAWCNPALLLAADASQPAIVEPATSETAQPLIVGGDDETTESTESTTSEESTDETTSEITEEEGDEVGVSAAPVLSEPVVETTSPTAGTSEVIQERYSNRTVKIERHVIQDAQSNYVNHGSWTMWDEQGKVMGYGEFQNGEREGHWVRVFRTADAEMLKHPLFKQHQAPFVSEADFKGGKLNGDWIVRDGKKRVVMSWHFEDGVREGKSVWYFPSGQKWREANYHAGMLDGELQEWKPEGQPLAKDTFVAGRRLAVDARNYPNGQKQSEAQYLYAREVIEPHYDFWTGVAKIKVVGTDGKNERHGPWVSWHKNGQKQVEGRYEYDKPVGKFVWWHENGQLAIRGEYEAGQQVGEWVWWHANGQKQLVGSYDIGHQSGRWTWWNDLGKVTEKADFSQPHAPAQQIAEPATESGDEPVQARATNKGPTI